MMLHNESQQIQVVGSRNVERAGYYGQIVTLGDGGIGSWMAFGGRLYWGSALLGSC